MAAIRQRVVISNASHTIEVGQMPCLLAALKADFDVDFVDLDTFVNVLLGSDSNPSHLLEANIHGDSEHNGRDIDPSVRAMLTL